MEFLFIDIPEIKIEIGHEGLFRVAQDHDILDDRGAERRCEPYEAEWVDKRQTREHFSRILLGNQTMIRECHTVKDKVDTRMPYSHKSEPSDFH